MFLSSAHADQRCQPKGDYGEREIKAWCKTFQLEDRPFCCDSFVARTTDQEVGWVYEVDNAKTKFYRAKGGTKYKRDAMCE
jgi:hypothetical protein